MRRALGLVALLALGGCAVEIPEQSFYRLTLPVPSGGGLSRAGVLRVGELQLAADLTGDRLMVARGPVRVQGYEFHQWAGPLDRIVGDALVAGLSRSGAFTQVKGEWEGGAVDLQLSGRVLEFHQVDAGGAWVARVTLELGLSEDSGRLLFQQEFTSSRPLASNDPEQLVVALSEGMGDVVEQVLARSEAAGLFERGLRAPPGK